MYLKPPGRQGLLQHWWNRGNEEVPELSPDAPFCCLWRQLGPRGRCSRVFFQMLVGDSEQSHTFVVQQVSVALQQDYGDHGQSPCLGPWVARALRTDLPLLNLIIFRHILL